MSFPKPPGLDQLQPAAEGFLQLTSQGVEEDCAQDPGQKQSMAKQIKAKTSSPSSNKPPERLSR